MNYDLSDCTLCPRRCGADRKNSGGYCGCGVNIKAAKAQLHFWEEPCISGQNGSGAIFFSGCTMRCVFCQNFEISTANKGKEISPERLCDIFLELQSKGVHNINLVNPTHFVPQIINALDMAKPKLKIPVVYNCGGYEQTETLKMLEGYIDIYLPDFKYISQEISQRYSRASDYAQYAVSAIAEMHRQQPRLVKNGDILEKGLVIRHLVLPGCRHDSIAVIEKINELLPEGSYLLSLMNQYTPNESCQSYPEINRRVTTFEYQSVLKKAQQLGMNGFSQGRESAESCFTPDFDFSGI